MSTEPRQPDDMPELARRLRGIYGPAGDVPASADRRVLDAAKHELAPADARRRAWWSLPAARTWAAAAVVAFLLLSAALVVIVEKEGYEEMPVAGGPGVPGHPGARHAPSILLALTAARDGYAEDADVFARVAVALADDAKPAAENPQPAPTHFTAIDVYVDPRGKPLAVYQLRIKLARGAMKVVGVESGEGAFAEKPPYYDRKAIDKPDAEEIVLAMFLTGDKPALPSGKTRVATIHLMTQGEAVPAFETTLETVAGPDGKPYPAQMEIRQAAPAIPNAPGAEGRS